MRITRKQIGALPPAILGIALVVFCWVGFRQLQLAMTGGQPPGELHAMEFFLQAAEATLSDDADPAALGGRVLLLVRVGMAAGLVLVLVAVRLAWPHRTASKEKG